MAQENAYCKKQCIGGTGKCVCANLQMFNKFVVNSFPRQLIPKTNLTLALTSRPNSKPKSNPYSNPCLNPNFNLNLNLNHNELSWGRIDCYPLKCRVMVSDNYIHNVHAW